MNDTTPIRKAFAADITAQPGERAVVAKISTAAVDREGDVMIPQGMDATQYEDNPVCFYNHDYDKPIGKCIKLWRDGDAIFGKTVFPARPAEFQGEWLPDNVFALMQAGVVKGFSIGFQGLEGGVRVATKGDVEKYGPDVRRVFSKWRLLEYSVAPLPMNQNALATAVSKGIVTEAGAKAMGLEVKDATDMNPDPKCPQCGVGEMLAMDTGMVRCKACGYEMPKGKDAKAATFPAVIALEVTDTTSFVKVTNVADLTEPAPIIVPRQLLYVITPPTQPVAPDPVKAAAEQVRIFVLKRQGRIYA